MEPIFGFSLFAVATIIVACVAWKRGRSGWLCMLLTPAAGFGLVVLANMAGASPAMTGLTAFLAPAVAFFMVLANSSSSDLAVKHGAHGQYIKCPYCAESVRSEAIKCRHCGSSLKTETPTEAS